MLAANEAKVLSLIGPADLVLDVGGWARPFNRADYVLDFQPYETRGRFFRDTFGLDAQGGPVEHFTAETFLRRDICDRDPWPFADGQFDFCVCSHTLEDIRDPLWVCRELMRVARRGYIEVPSRTFEACRDREPGVPVGLSHHRWHVEVRGGGLVFSPKTHDIHGDPALSIPKAAWSTLPESEMVSWLFWDGPFPVSEGWLTQDDLRAFARRYGDAPPTSSPDDPLLFAIWEARAQRDDALSELADLRSRLADLGPNSLRLALGLRNLARRHPRLSSALKRVLRPTA